MPQLDGPARQRRRGVEGRGGYCGGGHAAPRDPGWGNAVGHWAAGVLARARDRARLVQEQIKQQAPTFVVRGTRDGRRHRPADRGGAGG